MDWIVKAFGLLEILLVLAAIIFHKIISGKGSNPRPQIRQRVDIHVRKEASSASVASVEITQYRFKDLEEATNNFCDENKLGSGGFGVVYKGMLEGQLVAIKRLYGNSAKLLADVAKEVSLLSSLRNDNIVQLLGFCFESGWYLLVFEYIPNKDLHYWLSDGTKCQTLDWKLRFKIIEGFANGLCYLHHGSDNTIVHRDLKPANVMLDEYYNAKIADFGLSRDLDLNKTHKTTSKIAGTFGYIAPEVFSQQQYSTKSDVYSYGQLVLEIMVGCTIHQFANANEKTLSHVVWKQWKDKRPLTEVIDVSLQGNYPQDQVIRCILIGLLCVQDNKEKRPNMQLVKNMLNGNDYLPAPSFPGFFPGIAHGVEDSAAISVNFQLVVAYSLQDLKIATNNFCCKLQDDGSYVVYKGLLNGRTVAVEEYSGFADGKISNLVRVSFSGKILKFFSEKNKNIKKNFLLPRMRHPNVVEILGYSLEVEAKLFIVFEYPRHGRLADHLNKRPSNVAALDWPKRRKIALGTAQGLSYLHEECNPKVIHRNVRAANIFLDHDFEAVVGYFGHAKLIDDKDAQVATTVQEIIIHPALEYLSSTGKSSEKTDVFLYGIMLLELILGQQAFNLARLAHYDDAMLIGWVKVLLREKRLENLIDPDLQNNFIEIEVESLIQVALLCTRASPLQRPMMSEVVRMLKGGNKIEMCEEWHFLRGFPFIYAGVDPEIHLGQLKQFSLKELQIATSNFSYKSVIGRGGSGKVYKGRLVDGTLVAVKRMKDDHKGRENMFRKELEMNNMAIHRNLLRLRGFCVAQKERLLVYPYMTNGSVASILRERSSNIPPLDWPQRKNIALGAARGLSYLHHHSECTIIHRDIKATNILLDENFEAVVADFALAKLINDTHVTSAVRGTTGHIAPEYLSTGKVSEKTDVFGYGIMLLELVTGQRAFDLARLSADDDVMLLDWVKIHIAGNNFKENEVESLIKLALLCTQTSHLERPKMSEVVRMLEGGLETIKFPQMSEGWCPPERREARIYDPNRIYDSTDNLAELELSGPR